MLKNQNIICISSIDWDFIWQGHQEIMSTFADNDNRIIFIENTGVRIPTLRDFPRLKKRFINWSKGIGGIRKERENLYIFSPIVLPFPYSKIARWINGYLLLSSLNKWMRVMDFNDPIIWTFLPTGLTLDLINYINKKLIIYYCIDNFAVSSSLARKIRTTEEKLIKQSDLVFVTAKELYDYCLQYNQDVYSFPFGVNIEHFKRVKFEKNQRVSEDLNAIKRPIIGYIGGVHKWIDQDLVRNLARIYLDYSFVFIGPLQTDVSGLSHIKNVHFLGARPYELLPHYVNSFTAGIIPYLLTEYTKNVYPTKLNEYLALGKPVVSTDLVEIKAFNERYGGIVSVGKDYEGFAKRLEKTVNSRSDEQIIKKRIQVANDNTWQKKIGQMSKLIKEAIEKRKHDKDLRWKENLLRFYRVSGRRLKTATFAFLLTYLLLFYTPFIWFLASPLKISQAPVKADAIVVFGGGVGEGGSPGKSTIERARYAAELYKNGYANHVIFSSGYTYKYNDAENMKLIALSAGVAERNIILEQKANSTYENAKFTKEIINDFNWDSILLVSSPYNMRRASLVFKKIDKDLKIIYTPVANPQFYIRDGKIKWEQIRAIGHEYLGIVYYFVKGYI